MPAETTALLPSWNNLVPYLVTYSDLDLNGRHSVGGEIASLMTIIADPAEPHPFNKCCRSAAQPTTNRAGWSDVAMDFFLALGPLATPSPSSIHTTLAPAFHCSRRSLETCSAILLEWLGHWMTTALRWPSTDALRSMDSCCPFLLTELKSQIRARNSIRPGRTCSARQHIPRIGILEDCAEDLLRRPWF